MQFWFEFLFAEYDNWIALYSLKAIILYKAKPGTFRQTLVLPWFMCKKCFPLKGKWLKESGLDNLGWTVESEVVCLGIDPDKTRAHL